MAGRSRPPCRVALRRRRAACGSCRGTSMPAATRALDARIRAQVIQFLGDHDVAPGLTTSTIVQDLGVVEHVRSRVIAYVLRQAMEACLPPTSTPAPSALASSAGRWRSTPPATAPARPRRRRWRRHPSPRHDGRQSRIRRSACHRSDRERAPARDGHGVAPYRGLHPLDGTNGGRRATPRRTNTLRVRLQIQYATNLLMSARIAAFRPGGTETHVPAASVLWAECGIGAPPKRLPARDASRVSVRPVRDEGCANPRRRASNYVIGRERRHEA